MQKLRGQQQYGLTLIEVLLAVGIVAILVAVAAPGFESTIRDSQRTSCLGDTVNMLTLGRQEAATRQQPVALCGSSDQATCNTNNWESGWLLFVDNGDGSGGVAEDLDLNGDEELLRISGPGCGALAVRSSNFADSGGIGFDVDGLANDRGTLVICDGDDEESAAAVILNVSGQSRLATDDDDDGIVNQDDGTEVSCT